MTDEIVGAASPFFIVGNVIDSSSYYRDKLGFEVRNITPETDPFFAVVARGQCQLLLKEVGNEISPLPNRRQHEWAIWDAFVYVSEPALLAADFKSRNTLMHSELQQRDDGLYGFEIQDADGYVLFFGKPV